MDIPIPDVYTDVARPPPGNRRMNDTLPGRISRERRGHLLLLGLDRVAKRNAFDLPMLDDLVAALGEYEADDQLRCALLFAHGEHFTAGLDLANVGETFRQGWKLPEGAVDPWGTFGGRRPSKPLVVAVQGYCYTIGIELMLAADINLCASNARFAQLEVQRGILPFGGATLRMHQVAGWATPCAGCSPATNSTPTKPIVSAWCRKSPPRRTSSTTPSPSPNGSRPRRRWACAPPSARRARPCWKAKRSPPLRCRKPPGACSTARTPRKACALSRNAARTLRRTLAGPLSARPGYWAGRRLSI